MNRKGRVAVVGGSLYSERLAVHGATRAVLGAKQDFTTDCQLTGELPTLRRHSADMKLVTSPQTSSRA
ncbi:MAG: hypothetical protein OXB98_03110 [Bryobacterales bacterium]|nr:hypothetical protein [Bryobacterales bacterium]